MIVESRKEREKRGKPVGKATCYQAMGGITGFSSLAEGMQRLDASGKGEARQEQLERGDQHTLVKAMTWGSPSKPK